MQIDLGDKYPALQVYDIEDVDTEHGSDDNIREWVKEPDQLGLGFIEIGWRMYATNDGLYVYCQSAHQMCGSFSTSGIFRYKLNEYQQRIMLEYLKEINMGM